MTLWRASGLEKCDQCKELFPFNDIYFPRRKLGDGIICMGCLEKVNEQIKKSKGERR